MKNFVYMAVSRYWNFVLDKELKRMVLVSIPAQTLINGVHVDDIILAGSNLEQMEKVKMTLAELFNKEN